MGKSVESEFHIMIHAGRKTLGWDWLPGFFVFWRDKSLSATNFARPLKLLTPQPLEAGRVVGGVPASSRGGLTTPSWRRRKHLIQQSGRWPVPELRHHRGRGFWLRGTPAVCGCALGSSWLVNGSGSGKQGFTSAVIFEVNRRGRGGVCTGFSQMGRLPS